MGAHQGNGNSVAVEEVRLAMAWNGGGSLAIWMGGAAVELDAARRAHLGPEVEDGVERSLYHALAALFRRELVIDILAGASAGGINGALLGAVIAKRRALRPHFLRDRWLALGDLNALLRPISDSDPASLMQGQYFHDHIEAVFRVVTDEETADPAWKDQTTPSPGQVAGDVVLDIQVTNVMGAQRHFTDEWGETFYAREYRAPVKFRSTVDYSSETLAAAARASASFPAAFEPSLMIGRTAALAGFPMVKRWAVDGGLLENAPIRPAIDLIPTRHAEKAVTRFVCYVNAAPATSEKDPDDPTQPNLRDVLGDVVNLPREGRVIDQLIAIEEAVQAPMAVREAAIGLLGLPRPNLAITSRALFEAYRKPRTSASLRDLFSATPDGGLVTSMVKKTVRRLDGAQLPWIPASLTPPAGASEWQWGLRPAQRIILLQLDVLRLVVENDDPIERANLADDLLQCRKSLNRGLARLEDARGRFMSSPLIQQAALALAEAAWQEGDDFEEQLAELNRLMVGFRCEAFAAVDEATRTLHKALVARRQPAEATKAADGVVELGDELFAGVRLTDLFGETASNPFSRAHLDAFLERALAIEVIRRSFAPTHELEATQDLHFVQLTPEAHVQIFADHPFTAEGIHTGKEKLTGLGLVHFSAFYRHSWRVNDFMWGRLDAATRVVDLFVSPTRAVVIGVNEESPELRALVAVLVPEGSDVKAKERRSLAKEALIDAATFLPDVPEGCRAAASEVTKETQDVDTLRRAMTKAIAADLRDPQDTGLFTRVVCARAAQYEILGQEFQPLAEATARDGKLGCFTKPVPYDRHKGVLEQARIVVSEPPLPRRLGSGVKEELTSTLAVRTMSHAALVSISSAKAAGIPFWWPLSVMLRAPFLSLAGITAEKIRYRSVALLAFIAGSFYLTARVIEAKNGQTDLSAIWRWSSLATLVAIFSVLALVGLPLSRAWRATSWKRKLRQGGWGLAMFLASGLAALFAAGFAVGLGNAITSTQGFTIPTILAVAVVFVPLGASVVIRHVMPSVPDGRLTKWTSKMGITALVTAGVALILIYKSWAPLNDTITIREVLSGLVDGNTWRGVGHLAHSPSELWDAMKRNWREAAVIAAYASVPLAALYGLQGFVRRAIDLVRVGGARPYGPESTSGSAIRFLPLPGRHRLPIA